jgi:hypothetical protein
MYNVKEALEEAKEQFVTSTEQYSMLDMEYNLKIKEAKKTLEANKQAFLKAWVAARPIVKLKQDSLIAWTGTALTVDRYLSIPFIKGKYQFNQPKFDGLFPIKNNWSKLSNYFRFGAHLGGIGLTVHKVSDPVFVPAGKEFLVLKKVNYSTTVPDFLFKNNSVTSDIFKGYSFVTFDSSQLHKELIDDATSKAPEISRRFGLGQQALLSKQPELVLEQFKQFYMFIPNDFLESVA